jgi:hypothetical protein
VSGYTVEWESQPAFDDDGLRRRKTPTLTEARLIMQMAFIADRGFQPGRIIDSDGRNHPYELVDPRASEQDYLDHGFEHYDEWARQPAGR